METVGNFPDLASAKVAQSLLDAAGIDASIPDEYLSGVDWQMTTALHGIRLTVAPEDAEAAREILEAEFKEDTGDDPDAERCPRCGSDRVGDPRWRKRLKGLSFFFFPVLILYPLFARFAPRNECYTCGHRWNEPSTSG